MTTPMNAVAAAAGNEEQPACLSERENPSLQTGLYVEFLWWIEPNRSVFRQDKQEGHLVNPIKNNEWEVAGGRAER